MVFVIQGARGAGLRVERVIVGSGHCSLSRARRAPAVDQENREPPSLEHIVGILQHLASYANAGLGVAAPAGIVVVLSKSKTQANHVDHRGRRVGRESAKVQSLALADSPVGVDSL